jgi:hypothetical protein
MALKWRVLDKGIDGSFVWFKVGYFDTGAPDTIVQERRFSFPGAATRDAAVLEFQTYGRTLRERNLLHAQIDIDAEGTL